MNKKTLTFGALILLALFATSCAKLQARDNLNKGVRAFKATKYEQAIDYFQQAMKLDPDLTNAELYLATAYSQQFVPNSESPENLKNAEMAIKTFESVLQKDPKNLSAVSGIASVYQNSNKWDKARDYYKIQTQLDPGNPTPFYAIGSVDWRLIANKSNPLPEDEQEKLAEEGLGGLDTALKINPDYEEAMAYKNLLYREKARLAPDKDEKSKYLAMADEWFNKTLDTRRKAAEKTKVNGVHLDTK
jgi:tetratricopeptide (TPR) repeat protein